MRFFKGAICAVIFALQPLCVVADEQADAAAITEILLSDDVIEATFGAVGVIMGDLMIAEFQKTGTQISNEASVLLADMLLEEMVDRMGPALRETQRAIYLETLTGQELKDYYTFLLSPSGQAVAQMQGILVAEGAKRGEALGLEIAPTLLANVMVQLEAGHVPYGANQKAFDELAQIMAKLN